MKKTLHYVGVLWQSNQEKFEIFFWLQLSLNILIQGKEKGNYLSKLKKTIKSIVKYVPMDSSHLETPLQHVWTHTQLNYILVTGRAMFNNPWKSRLLNGQNRRWNA